MNALPTKKTYILDTNILFGFSLWIPINLNKVFWSKLESALQSGGWILLDVVVSEVKYDEDLKKWCAEQKKNGLIKSISDDDRNRAVEINNAYKMIDETTQKSTVDTYLIAHAEANGYIILSRESSRFKDADLYKIPDVCNILNVQHTSKPEHFYKAIGYKN